MLVSIIVTSHNYAEFLREAIDSALDQDYPDVEVIVVDDGSEDESREIISTYGDGIRAIFKERNGQCSAINVGFAASRGDVILTLDADDILLENAASLHVEGIRNGAVRSCGYMMAVDESGVPNGRIIPLQLPPTGDYRAATLRHGLDVFQASFTSGSAWSRSFLETVLPLPEDFPLGADGYLTAVDRFFGPIAFVHQPVVRYRQHARNGGPSRLRFDSASLKKRLRIRARRIDFASRWLKKLDIKFDERRLSRVGDWRLQLIIHYLYMTGERSKPVPFKEFVTAPFGRIPSRYVAALRVSSALFAVRVLPRASGIKLAERLLERAYKVRQIEQQGSSAAMGTQSVETRNHG